MKTIMEIIADGQAILQAKDVSFVATLKAVVFYVERVAQEITEEAKELSFQGKEKREIAVILLNKAINIPFIPESWESVIFGYLVDKLVSFYNKTGWPDK